MLLVKLAALITLVTASQQKVLATIAMKLKATRFVSAKEISKTAL
jgi:hypothetical protein